MGIRSALRFFFNLLKDDEQAGNGGAMTTGPLVDFNEYSELYWLKRAGAPAKSDEDAAKDGTTSTLNPGGPG